VNLEYAFQTSKLKKQMKHSHRVMKSQGRRTGTRDTIHKLSIWENSFSQSPLECTMHNSQKYLHQKF